MLRKLLIGLIGLLLITGIATQTRAETTVPPLSFNVVSALAKEKDVQKGLETALKEQSVVWFWELGGGLEKAMTANNEAEFTEALGKKVELIKTLHTVGMAYAEGKYTDAALAIADSAIGSLNNPAATAVWEMVKLTRESYIAVKSTKDALNVETLYGRVNNDRRLIGQSVGGAPPTININAETVDYFFNKYLITDAGTRTLVKSYVETGIGQDWPEESWNDYMLGMVADTKGESEVRQLQSDKFRNVARGWIRTLLADVNKQVTLEYYRMRVRQEMAEYEEYANKIANYYENGYPAMWQILRRQKEAKEKIPEYKKQLEQAKAVIEDAQKAHSGAETADQHIKVYDKHMPVLSEHDRKLMNSAAAVYLTDETSLYNDMEETRGEISKVRELLYSQIEETFDGEAHTEPEWTGQTDYEGDPMPDHFGYESMLAQYLRPLFAIESIEDYESQVDGELEAGIKFLNKGDINGARTYWRKTLGLDAKEASGNTMWQPVYESMEESRQKLDAKCDEDPESISSPNFRQKVDERVNYRERKGVRLSGEALQRFRDEVMESFKSEWKTACKQAKKELKMAHGLTHSQIAGQNNRARGLLQAYRGMRDVSQEKYDQLISLMARIKEMSLPTEVLASLDTDGASLYKAQEEYGEWCPTLPKKAESGLAGFGGYLLGLSSKLQGMGGGEGYFQELTGIVEEKNKKLMAAEELWKDRIKLTSEDKQMIAVFVEGGETLPDELKAMERHVSFFSGYISAAERDLEEYITKARHEYNDCADTSDRLTAIGTALEKWQAGIIKSGLVKGSREGNKLVPAMLTVDQTGMARADKPYRHYMTADNLKDVSRTLRANAPSGAALSYLASKHKDVYREYEDLVSLKTITPARSENMILGDVIYLDEVIDMANRFEVAEAGEESFTELMDEASIKYPEVVQKHSATYLIFTPQPNGIEAELESNTGKAYVELATTIKRRWTDHTDAIGEAMLIAEEEGRKKFEEEQEKMFARQQPLDSNGYWIIDPRLNSKPYQAGASRVVLMNDDLRSGRLYLTGRINTLENVEKVLLSVDERRTWEELPLAPTIAFYITPRPNTNYKPYVQLIRSPGFDPIYLSLSNDTEIVFSNQSYSDRIVKAMKLIAESYERQNLALFSNLIADDYIGGRVALEEGVRFDFEMFTNIQLKLYVSRITEAGRGKFVVTTKWDKKQTPRTTGVQQKSSGDTIITLVEQEGALKIQNLRGDLLYATLSPDVAAASGLSQAVVEDVRVARDDRNPIQPGAGTSESGGSASSVEGSILTTNTVNKTFAAGQCYDFDNNVWAPAPVPGPGAVYPVGADICFEGAMAPVTNVHTAVSQDMSGTNTFANLSTAPDAGYAAIFAGVPGDIIGRVHAFKSTASKYGKFEITSAIDVHGDGSESIISFKYAIQTDGSKNIATH